MSDTVRLIWLVLCSMFTVYNIGAIVRLERQYRSIMHGRHDDYKPHITHRDRKMLRAWKDKRDGG